MSYKNALLKAESSPKSISTHYVDWENLEFPRKKRKPIDTIKEEVINENDILFHNITNDLKEHFYFKGFLENCNMSKLFDIVSKHITLEEVVLDDDEEENIDEEEDVFCII